MLISDLYSEFISSVEKEDTQSAYNALMKELGNILVRKKDDFVHLLNESGILASTSMSDVELVNLYVQNIPTNQNLMLGSSLLFNMYNKQTGFNGEDEISDDGVKTGYFIIKDHFTNTGENAEDFENIGGAWAGAVQGAAQVAKGVQDKRAGALGIAQKQADTRSAMIQQVLTQRQIEAQTRKTQLENRAKTTKTLLIIGGVVVGLALLGTVIYVIRKK